MNQNVFEHTRTTPNVPSGQGNWKWFPRVMSLAVLVLGAGCSGIHASKSVSPLDFILPGLMKHEPPPTPNNEPTPAAKAELPA